MGRVRREAARGYGADEATEVADVTEVTDVTVTGDVTVTTRQLRLSWITEAVDLIRTREPLEVDQDQRAHLGASSASPGA